MVLGNLWKEILLSYSKTEHQKTVFYFSFKDEEVEVREVKYLAQSLLIRSRKKELVVQKN